MYYGLLWLFMGIMVTSSIQNDNMTSDSRFEFLKFFTRKDLKERLKQPQNPQNQVKSRLYPVKSGQILLNPVSFDRVTDVIIRSWLLFFPEFLRKFWQKNYQKFYWSFFEDLFLQNVSLLNKYERPWLCFYFIKFKNRSSICSILWSHLNKS